MKKPGVSFLHVEIDIVGDDNIGFVKELPEVFYDASVVKLVFSILRIVREGSGEDLFFVGPFAGEREHVP